MGLWLLASALGIAVGPAPIWLTPGAVGQPSDRPEYREFRTMVLDRCNKGDLQMCFQAGKVMQKGLGGPADEGAARRLFERACNGHISAACYQLDPDLLHRDERRSAELGCRDGQQSFCYSLAGMLKFGIGGPADPGRAETLLETACRKGYAQACAKRRR